MAKTVSSFDLISSDQLGDMKKEMEKELGGKLFFGNAEELRLRFLPLNIKPFDDALNGGLAFDRIAMIVGAESSGKTVLAMHAMKSAIDKGLSVAFVDAERTWTPEWAETLGLDASKVLVTRPSSGEEAFQHVVYLVRKQIGLVVLDSIGVLVPVKESERDIDEMFETRKIGAHPQLVTSGINMILKEISGSCVILVNQLRSDIGGYGNPESIPGGRALKHDSWQIIRMSRAGWIEEGTGVNKRRLGFMMKINVNKNKQGVPFTEAEAPFYFTGEIDETVSILDEAVELGIIKGNPPYYVLEYPDQETGELITDKAHGKKALTDKVKSVPGLLDWIKIQIDEVPSLDI